MASTVQPDQLEEVSCDGSLSANQLESLRTNFESNSQYRLAQNAVCKTTVTDVALDRRIVTSTDHSFSHLLDEWKVTNQKKSGRCWMFAGLNLLRVSAMKAMKLKEFELSQNYTFFWDKFERSNYFFERIIETADRGTDDRHVAWLLERPLDDGGQWNMFVNVVRKYGLVPQAAMPETESSSNSGRMNGVLLYKLREGAQTLRAMAAEGADVDQLRATKNELLQVVFRILSIHLGTPPESFDWQWSDRDQKFHRDGRLTPQEFAQRYVTIPLDDYVCLVHDPRPEHPVGRTYTVELLGNVEGGRIVKYLNVEIDLMKQIAARAIIDGEPVWMGADCGPMMQRDLGLWDERLYDYPAVYNTEFSLTKAERLTHHQTAMNHAMLFTGVDLVEENGRQRSRRWRVENSWGEESGRKGFFVMNDNWFDEHMFEIAARREHLPAELQSALDETPTILPPWDPMGSLAHSNL